MILQDSAKGLFVCASLPDQEERRRSVASRFRDKRQLVFVESIDGRNWSINETEAYMSLEFRDLWRTMRERGRKWLSSGAVACALTHRDKMLPLAENNDIIICEDDAKFSHEFIELWRQAELRKTFNAIRGVVLLHYIAREPIKSIGDPIADLGKYKIFRIQTASVASTASYYISPNCAGELRVIQTPLIATPDSWMLFKGKIKDFEVFVVDPPPVQIFPFDSSVGYGGRRLNGVLAPILQLLRVCKWQIDRWRGRRFDRVEKAG